MNKTRIVVNVLLVLFGIILLVAAAFLNSNRRVAPINNYEDDLRLLNDTIKELKEDIDRYKVKITMLNLERTKIRQELNQIITENEKTDFELVNGSLDDNIKFLTEYLSQKDSLAE